VEVDAACGGRHQDGAIGAERAREEIDLGSQQIMKALGQDGAIADVRCPCNRGPQRGSSSIDEPELDA
jgi:hypothetical protein